MTITYKALAALLGYPTASLVEDMPEIAGIVGRETRLPKPQRAALLALMDQIGGGDLLSAQESYVALFDRGRATSLNLFEHVHGESRDRGQAMVDLNAMYARAGLRLSAKELPDYLPALLEFLSLQPDDVARAMIDDCERIIRSLGDTLTRRASAYASVLDSVLVLAGQRGLDAIPKGEEPPEKPLDDEWVDQPVIFGPAGGCGAGAKPAETSVVNFVPRRSAG